MTTHVLYHGNCYDGAWAAHAVWTCYGDADTRYYAMDYGKPLPQEVAVAGKNDAVIMVDYSRPKAEILELCGRLSKVTVLDHHKTAAADLAGIDCENAEIIFDLAYSGAYLAWEHFNGPPVPLIIQHVSDRDLWKFEMEGTKEIHAFLCTHPMDFRELYKSLRHKTILEMVQKGTDILRYHEHLIELFCKQAYMVRIGEHEVPCVDICFLYSEVPHRLLDLYPNAPFAMYRFRKAEQVIYGLRGRGDFDVSKVAKQFGGGGHHNAAGFQQEACQWVKFPLPRELAVTRFE